MAERFIKFIPSKTAMFLVTNKNIAYQNAFRLLTIIAEKARRYEGHPDGLGIGQCELGDWKAYGMSEQNYRSAKKVLLDLKLIKVIETNRGLEKVTTLVTGEITTKVTTKRTIVKLTGSDVYDINISFDNDLSNDQSNDLSNRQPTTFPQGPIRNKESKERDKKEENIQKKAGTFVPTAFATQVVDAFFSSLLSAIPDFPQSQIKKNKTQYQAADRIGRMCNEDFTLIKTVIAFAHQQGGFWITHVHSVKYLEDKFVKLREQAKGEPSKSRAVPDRQTKWAAEKSLVDELKEKFGGQS